MGHYFLDSQYFAYISLQNNEVEPKTVLLNVNQLDPDTPPQIGREKCNTYQTTVIKNVAKKTLTLALKVFQV